jgi:diguanylate cyclase (GGDEF)-like protein
MLFLWSIGRRRWPRRLVRRLTTLGVMAAAAERAVRAGRGAGTATPFDSLTGLYNEPFLAALLSHALVQAERRREPLAILSVGLDPTLSTGSWLTPETSDAALQHMARAITGTLRASDIVARRDDDCMVVVLPASDVDNSQFVAEELCRAIAEAGLISSSAMPLTASIGIAGFPDHSEDAETLLILANDALERAQSLGGNRAEVAPSLNGIADFRVVPCAG